MARVGLLMSTAEFPHVLVAALREDCPPRQCHRGHTCRFLRDCRLGGGRELVVRAPVTRFWLLRATGFGRYGWLVAEPAVLADSGVSSGGRRWRVVVLLGAGLLVAAAPAAAVLIWVISAFSGAGPANWLMTVIGLVFAAVAVVVPAVAISWRARHAGVRVPGPAATLTIVVAVQAAAMAGLDHLAPFRFGLLSVLLYGAPAVLLVVSVLARTRRPLAVCAILAAAVFVLAVPVRLLQQAVCAWEWTHAAGVPSRAWLQVIDIPGRHQQMYDWDARSQILGGYWAAETGPGDSWAAVEAVTSDHTAMFTAVAWAVDGYADPGNTRCTRLDTDLWQCEYTGISPADIAFVRRTDGVMIVLTGWDSAPVLLHSIRAAHPASDAELQARSGLVPRSPLGLLLL
jgi:hypothetical protein